MGFGIIRARNLSAGDIAETDKHNSRRYSTEDEYPINIDFKGEHYSRFQTEIHEDYLSPKDITLQEAIDIRLKENNVKGIRKNSNIAIEYVATISDKKAWDNYSFTGFASNTKKWLEDRHGPNSVIATFEHQDESNPHVHFVVVPLEKKTIKWKNQKSSGERIETRLNTRKFTGGREKLRKLQDDYFEHLTERYGVGEKNKFKVPLFRGTKAENQQREYSQKTNLEIKLLRDELRTETDTIVKLELQLKIAKKQAEMLKKEAEAKQEKQRHEDISKRNWKSKGTKDTPTIFHTEKKKKSKGFKR